MDGVMEMMNQVILVPVNQDFTERVTPEQTDLMQELDALPKSTNVKLETTNVTKMHNAQTPQNHTPVHAMTNSGETEKNALLADATPTENALPPKPKEVVPATMDIGEMVQLALQKSMNVLPKRKIKSMTVTQMPFALTPPNLSPVPVNLTMNTLEMAKLAQATLMPTVNLTILPISDIPVLVRTNFGEPDSNVPHATATLMPTVQM